MALAPIENDLARRFGNDAQHVLLANIGHELKTPASALCVLAEALAGERDSSAREQLARRVRSEAHRLCNTVDDLIDLGLAGESRSVQVCKGRVLAEEAIARLALSAEIERVDVVVDGDDVDVRGNAVEITSAVHHLIENAIKHSPVDGRVEVCVRNSGSFGEIDVTDRGVGISAEHQQVIFDRFFRVEESDQDDEGTGLGLAIVKQAAANNAGEVLVRSTLGQGTTFTLRLPRGTSYD